MAKDAKGHGSEARGGTGGTPDLTKGGKTSYSRYPDQNFDRFGNRRSAGADGRMSYQDKDGNVYSLPRSQVAGQFGEAGGQPVESNAHAAATLASGTKSAPVDMHPAMSGGPRNAQGYRTTGTAYEGPRTPTPAHGYVSNDPGNTRYRNGQKMPTDL